MGPLARAALLLAPVALLPAALFATAGGKGGWRPSETPRRTARLVVCSPHWEGIREEVGSAFRRWLFERERVDVEVTWLEQGGGTKTLRWIEEQFRANDAPEEGIDVDVFFGGGSDPYETLKDAGLLQRYEPPAALLDPSRLPPDLAGFPLYDPERYWFGTCLTGFGILVNERVLEALERFQGVAIRDWRDLADPRLEGWVGSADPRSSSSYHTYFEIVLQQKEGFAAGMRLLREIGGNVSAYNKFSAEIPKLCAVGQFAVAPAIDQYALAQIEAVAAMIPEGSQPPLRFFLPEGRTLINPDAVAILKGAPNREIARRFIDFLLSDEAGALWMLKRGESLGSLRGPRVHGLNRATVLPALFERFEREAPGATLVRENPFRLQLDFHYDYALAKRRWALLNDLLGAFLIDTRDELARAIGAFRRLDGERRREAEQVLFALPFTEAELERIVENEWKDPVKREHLRIEWTAYARARYEQIAALPPSPPSPKSSDPPR